MDIAVIVPALHTNKYHPLGDFAPFGDVTLLEWKIAQLRKVFSLDQIYITSDKTDFDNLVRFSAYDQLKLLQRPQDLSFLELVQFICKSVPQPYVMIPFTITPFMGASVYGDMVALLEKHKDQYNSVVTAHKLHEYIFDHNGNGINFTKMVSRRDIEPVHLQVNGAYLFKKDALETSFPYSRPCYFHNVNKFEAIEVKGAEDLEMARQLIPAYFSSLIYK